MENKSNEARIVDILSHSRHDWMNKLQLIKGNLSLQKYDRIKDIIEEIVIEAQQESKLCNLKMPAFASFLMTFNWSKHQFYLEYEVIGELKVLKEYDELLTKWSKGFLDILDHTVDSTCENHLCLTLKTDDQVKDKICFIFEFDGKINNTELVTEWIHSTDHTEIGIDDFEISTYELNTAISLTITDR
ncbi:stage 0 sporulation protein B (sporulation initiation phosphotransferase) [Metabacillus crassostreae]|uniref:Spo0B C-terminal domain-containing protein n=1 Tax=Metabacillus crassostreae TaxID=929098 RepID=UPI0019566278|nr:Spo0B C-terminal domain-containing protein [Metabacillus crassostreae]MBM7605760.1 stage 0 sporulation protein B (sporulation initiation phosphotransferase) [Metabacillus crassostreae]